MKQKGNVLIVIVILIVLAGIGVGIYFYAKNHLASKSTSTATTTPSTKTSNTITDACTTFTKANAATILGTDAIEKNTSVSNTTVAADNTLYSCTYATLDTSDAGYNAVTISIKRFTTTHGAELTYTSSKIASPDLVSTTGQGDQAYWTAKWGQLHILSNSDYIIVSTYKKERAKAIQIAEILLPKI